MWGGKMLPVAVAAAAAAVVVVIILDVPVCKQTKGPVTIHYSTQRARAHMRLHLGLARGFDIL